MSKYEDIAMKLSEKLARGDFNPGDRFYSEKEICSLYSVSSTTAVKVLNTLQEQNRVTRVQGSGTFVAKEAHRRIVMFTDLNLSEGKSEAVKVLSVKKSNKKEILAKMKLPTDGEYVEVHRLRYIGNETSQYTISYLNPKLFKPKDFSNLTDFTSIYQLVRDSSGLDPYNLPYHQRNVAKVITDPKILASFDDNQQEKLFICQSRQTFLPATSGELFEHTLSYKLPQYWGFEEDAAAYYS